MKLEDQENSEERIKKAIKDRAEKIKNDDWDEALAKSVVERLLYRNAAELYQLDSIIWWEEVLLQTYILARFVYEVSTTYLKYKSWLNMGFRLLEK